MVYPDAGLDTPRADAGNSSIVTNSYLEVSLEPSFHSPSKDRNDLVKQLKGTRRRTSLKTPRNRAPFADRRNFPSAASRGEFTPLLHSVTKTNHSRRVGKENNVPPIPEVLRGSLHSFSGSPALPLDNSLAYRGDFGSSFGPEEAAGTPIPPVPSSSAMSTPLAMLPKRDAGGVLVDGAQMMTLREQENIIDKVEKENFGLKLKIHFLEEALRKKDPAYNEAALKENTDLKVDKITMQHELSRYRKTLGAAEKDLETYRHQLAQVQERMKRRHADEGQREELEQLRQQLADKELEIEELNAKINSTAASGRDLNQLKDEIGDLEAEGREKDRLLEERDEEIEELREKAASSAATASDLEDELANVNEKLDELNSPDSERDAHTQKLDDLQRELDTAEQRIDSLESDLVQQSSEAEQANKLHEQACQEKDRIQADLDELREDMSNKSFSSKGLSRQLEEKAKKLQDEVETIREEQSKLQEEHQTKIRECERLQEKVDDLIQDGDSKLQNLNDDLELALHEKDIAVREQNSVKSKLASAEEDLLRKSEEKDLLQSRHESLTTESSSLQKDLAKCKSRIEELENDLDEEREHALENDRAIREEVEGEIEQLKGDYEDLRHSSDENERRFDAEEEKWMDERQNLESRCEKAEEQAAGLERTLSKFHEADGQAPGRDTKIQEALQSEKDRHSAEEAVLSRQIDEMNAEAETRRHTLDEVRNERSKLREELRASKREEIGLQEKIQGLEDEIEVLQSTMEEEGQQNARLQSSESQHIALQKEKQALQDQFANLNIEMHSLRTALNEVEAQRDEIKSELKTAKHQNDDTVKLDQEKVDLRVAKSRLETDIARLREDKKSLAIKAETIERELEEEIEKAGAEETRMEVEIEDLKRRLLTASGGRDKELRSATKNVQHLEAQVQELEVQLREARDQLDGVSDLSILRKDLGNARTKERESSQREAAQRENIREMKRRISGLERSAHGGELSRLDHESSKDQIQRYGAKEMELQSRINELETSREILLQDLDDLRLLQEHETAKNATSEQTINRLRKSVQRLDSDLQSARSRAGDQTITLERKDLHEMLRDTKIELEDLQLQLQDGQHRIDDHARRENDLRLQLKRVREERSTQTQKADFVLKELDTLQRRYERTLEKKKQMQDNFEMERKALTHGVRFPNISSSSIHQNETALLQLEAEAERSEKRHGAEIKGLARQIGYLRARCQREQGFRADLAYAKKFFLMQVQLYSACNHADLQMIEEMGISPDRTIREKRPSLRSAVYMVMAANRMRKGAQQWREQVKIRQSLVKSLEGMKKSKLSGRKSLGY